MTIDVRERTDDRPVPPRLPALTGVRILAALAVYVSHVPRPEGVPLTVNTFLSSGYMGVTLFFVLSGFVLAINYAERLRRPTPRAVYGYAVARFARVYPLYLLILLYIIVRQHALGATNDGWWQHILAVQAWSPNLDQAFGFNAPGWSISVEFFLYACFPVLIPLLARLRTPRATLLAGGLVALAMVGVTAWFAMTGRGDLGIADPGSAHRWLYRMPLLRLGDFALGIIAALLFLQLRGRPRLARLGAPLAIGAAIVTIALMAWPSHWISAWSWDVSYALPAVVLIFGLAIAPLSVPARLLSLPFVVLLGEASYAFYLVHHPALAFLGAGRWAVELSLVTIVYELFTLGAILALAVGLHVIVERPARVVLRRWMMWPIRRHGRASGEIGPGPAPLPDVAGTDTEPAKVPSG